MRDARLDHRLNEPCPDCGDAMWLHTSHCLVVKTRGRSRTGFTRCKCKRTAKDFAA
jgi:hypothetical protein